MKAQLYKDSKGEWRWRLLADNGRTLADSGEGYEHRSDALSAFGTVCGPERMEIETVGEDG